MTKNLIETFLVDYQGTNPGCALVVLKNNEPIYQFYGGLADVETGVPVMPETNFRLASVTKQFTAAAVMLLVERGILSLDDTLSRFFPVIPQYAKNVTVFELLTHQSGILDYEELLKHVRGQIHDQEVFDLEMNQSHGYFDAGKGYRYSNSGYCVLEVLVEKLSGTSYAEFMKQNFFEPLGMKGTVVDEEGVTQVPNRAYGYTRTETGWIRTDEDQTSATIGDGGIYSSVLDMARWNEFLTNSAHASMFVPHVLTDEDGGAISYGFGMFLKNENGRPIQYHGGSSIGFRTGIYRVPEQDLSVIFLSNRNEGEGSAICDEIAHQFL